MSETTTTTLSFDYEGIPQEEAARDLHVIGLATRKAARSLVSHEAGVKSSAMDIGRMLNEVANSGMAVAAYNEIASREFIDGRKSAMSTYIGEYLSDAQGVVLIGSTRASEYQETARKHDGLTARGVDMSKIPASNVKNILKVANLDEVAETLKTAITENDGEKLTMDEFKAVGRDAGFVNQPNSSGPSGPKVTVDAITEAMSMLTISLTADGASISKSNHDMAVRLHEALGALIG